MDFDEIQQIFFQECEEGLAGMEANFALLNEGVHDDETINAVFRCVHSIKGGAGAFGHERLQAYTHRYETLLDLVRNGTLDLTPALLSVAINAFDVLSDHVAAARDGVSVPSDDVMLERLAAAADTGAAQKVAAAAIVTAPEPPSLDASRDGGAASTDDDFADLMALLDDVEPAADASATETPATAKSDWRLIYRPAVTAFDHGAEPLLLLRELAQLGGVVTECDCTALPPLDTLDPDCAYLVWHVTLPAAVTKDDILTVFEFSDDTAVTLSRGDADDGAAIDPAEPGLLATDDDLGATITRQAGCSPEADLDAPTGTTQVAGSEPPVAATKPAVAAPTQTIRVDLDKLDRLVNLVGELVITQAMLAQRLSEHDIAGATELSDLEHLTRELQDSTMAIRAQPMKTVFSRVPRIIRELEGETGKRVRLEVEGEMTEVDKTVVERIGEPLTHLIRNAVDHGLETPQERVDAGKPCEGVVRLSAAHQSGRIVITVADDGRGIDRARVRAKAIERGIILPDAPLSEEEIDNLIFSPGFSTAAAVSNVSGRGVGMDVVRQNIQSLGGRIGIQSREGVGSSFSLSLPLTLAVLDGMVVTVGAQTLVIPLSHIVESLRPSADMISRFGPDGALLDVRGAYVRVLAVADRFGVADAERDPAKAVLIVVDGDHGQAALLVDTIQDQRQVVVKSLETNYQAIPGVAGVTIMGDGRVALIVDVDALTKRATPVHVPQSEAA